TIGGYVVYVGTQSGSYSNAYDVGNTLAFSYPNAIAGQPYYFALAAYYPGPTIGAKSSEIVGYSNAPPTITNPGSQFSAQGQSTSLQLIGSDPDGQRVAFSAAGLPPGLTISPSGVIAGAGTGAGTFSVEARVSDGTLAASTTFTWTITSTALVPPTPISP